MSDTSVTIPKRPQLPAAQDYFRLRREAIDYIQRLGSKYWTDYNTHDPGITLLESLLYTITDLGWRAGWDIKDLLFGAKDQPFYTARDILTINPTTPDDYRRLFIDIDSVRNAWVTCKDCACSSGNVAVKGLYDVWVELESDSLVGDLNNNLIEQQLKITSGSNAYKITVESRFPQWQLANQSEFDTFRAFTGAPFTTTCTRLMRTRTGESLSNVIIDNEELHQHWRNVFYATLHVSDGTNTVIIPDVSLRLFASAEGKNATTVADVVGLLERGDELSPVGLYHRKVQLVSAAVEASKAAYHRNRNLGEDLCRLDVINVEQVAVCADVHVEPDADIERVQAEIWFAIENYLAPSIPFYSLSEMLADGTPVEDIFNGPILDNGFIKQVDLDAAQLRKVVRGSDIINLVMDIEGVVSISKLQITKYDGEGNPVRGSVDPTFVNGEPVFDANRLSASWLLYVSDTHQPRLYHNLSNFTFNKEGLPFLVDQDEAYDVLTQLRGAAERPKLPGVKNNIPVPTGVERKADDISPVQYLLPLTYGVGPEGLPGHSGPLRRAQALQLKAYLMVFEQLLANAFQQVADVSKLFSLSNTTAATYASYPFTDGKLAGYSAVTNGLTPQVLAQLTESHTEFVERRNIFLDHLLARYGLDVSAYALLLTNWKGQSVAREALIGDKLGLLAAYPEISSGRARAFNHRHEPTMPSNNAVLKRRTSLLLGFPDLHFDWTYDESVPSVVTITGYQLVDVSGSVWIQGTKQFNGSTRENVTRIAAEMLLDRLSTRSAYVLYSTSAGYSLEVVDESAVTIATVPELYSSVSAAEEAVEELAARSAMSRAIIVEHLLLRPKFPGDAEYRECQDCDEADPWSFRLTAVMPGWTAPYNINLDLRDFANRTIKEEIPSHLLGKVCWVGNDGYEINDCDPVIDSLQKLIEDRVTTEGGVAPDCETSRSCATLLYTNAATRLAEWRAEQPLSIHSEETLPALLKTLLSPITPADVACSLDLTIVWSDLVNLLVPRFVDVIQHGLQFNRFERAWYDWLAVDAPFDWGEERLVERVEALLKEQTVGTATGNLCSCAADIVNTFGNAFNVWLTTNIASGKPLSEFTPFIIPDVTLCPNITFLPGTESLIEFFLEEKYNSYIEVSYRLTTVVRMLEALTNTYPAATLHDCDDGSDQNPVRLNQTALGALTSSASGDITPTPLPDPTESRSNKRPRKRKT